MINQKICTLGLVYLNKVSIKLSSAKTLAKGGAAIVVDDAGEPEQEWRKNWLKRNIECFNLTGDEGFYPDPLVS